MGKQILVKQMLSSVILLVIVLSLFTACSGNSAIVGEWAEKGSTYVAITFYEDGSYSGPDYLAGSKYTVLSYSIMSDGTLSFKLFGGETNNLKRVSSEEPNSGEYYLSGDTLIIGKKEYERVKK